MALAEFIKVDKSTSIEVHDVERLQAQHPEVSFCITFSKSNTSLNRKERTNQSCIYLGMNTEISWYDVLREKYLE